MTAIQILLWISNLILLVNISYGAFFILVRYKKTDAFIATIAVMVPAALANMVLSTGTINWYWSLIVAFLCAILFHLHIRRRLTSIYLQEYCNYKIFIETYGIILSVAGIIATLLLPPMELITAILMLAFIVRLTWLLLFKKKAYQMKYPNPEPLNNPLVSIVVIAFNEENYIGQTMESLKDQTYRNFEVILVDDHSQDATLEIAKAYEHLFPLKIVQKEVRGCSRSRNFGAENAKGEIILFLDADITLPPDFLQKSLTQFSAQNLGAAFFDFTPITDHRSDHLMTFFYRLWLKITQYHNPRAIGSCIMIRRALHKAVLFDETVVMAEDFDYIRRAVCHGKFRMLNNPRYQVSWRRFGVENRLKLVTKYLIFETHRQLIGEIRRPVLSYQFGHYDKEKE